MAWCPSKVHSLSRLWDRWDVTFLKPHNRDVSNKLSKQFHLLDWQSNHIAGSKGFKLQRREQKNSIDDGGIWIEILHPEMKGHPCYSIYNSIKIYRRYKRTQREIVRGVKAARVRGYREGFHDCRVMFCDWRATLFKTSNPDIIWWTLFLGGREFMSWKQGLGEENTVWAGLLTSHAYWCSIIRYEAMSECSNIQKRSKDSPCSWPPRSQVRECFRLDCIVGS